MSIGLFGVDLQAKKSITSHLCTVSDFAIEMFDVLDAINYQSYNDFVLRVGEWKDVAQTHMGLNKQWAAGGRGGGGVDLLHWTPFTHSAGKFVGKCITESVALPPGSSSQRDLNF